MRTENVLHPISLQHRRADNGLLKLTRRQLLTRTVAVTGSVVLGGSFIAASDAAWALEVKSLKPETMATLVQMARDIYPHDSFRDEVYVTAVKGHDDKAAEDAEFKTLIEEGIAALDKAAQDAGHPNYLSTGWESDRTAILKSVESGDLFQTVRGGLVVGLYNQPEVWSKLGYEGTSFDKGGYLYPVSYTHLTLPTKA